MNRIGYSMLVVLLSPLLILYLLWRGKKSPDYRLRWAERFALTRLRPTELLVHSVSMGETLAAVPLVRQLLQAKPQLRITMTTSSPTGSAEVHKAFAAELASGRMQHCYLPFDLPMCIRRFLRQVAPQTLIIMETELWPNLIHFAGRRGCQIVLANGRLSEKSFAQYRKWPGISRPMLSQLAGLAVQTDAEAQRFMALGVDSKRICVCGSLKFDLQIDPQLQQQAQKLRQQWGRSDEWVWVAGSVHPGEFAAVITAHQQILAQRPGAMLIMVPRHPEQFDAAAQCLQTAGLTFVRRSCGDAVTANVQVVLGDTMGELLRFYGVADQAFIGGTLIANGGHNPLEAAAMGLPVVMGPNFRDFTEITRLLREAGNLAIVADADELTQRLMQLFTDVDKRQQACDAGLQVVASNRGAQARQLAQILAVMD
ncbi:3-deoxy-D-manno-octulosonic acid transferase [Shewanella sp. NFH-SH190041]|uniref:lipid IV(A) 3-deoxy-D-manno-octulosonic acid transferase n=1 Tax=Shewanella sp. NFH-SH190041 TaxID=2950245 RepID=UPI0021C44255|nr:lipid IV(A) 3-deoxy-D-manno-octulosonic acid transferase [Shewanella sp. NFH-SH190041]BDM62759.1 3-deoxy-D-manno-octulosonic acid transferase [Shewanella sp. NFH-SH190041]